MVVSFFPFTLFGFWLGFFSPYFTSEAYYLGHGFIQGCENLETVDKNETYIFFFEYSRVC